MIKIGITGGIGSGKSVISSLLTLAGIPVYVADDESKYLLDTSPVIQKKLKALLCEDIYVNDKLDSKRFASLIFADEELLKKVNGIIHPAVRSDFERWVSKLSSKRCAIESAILFESGFDKIVDIILMVYAPVELRLSRTMQRDNATEADIMKRMNRQMPDALKREQADFVIVNDGIQAITPQIEKFIKILPKK